MCGRAKTGAFDVIVSYSACSVKAGFTSDGVRVRSVRLYDLMTTASWFRLRLRRLRWSENKVVGVVSRSGTTKAITFKRVNPERALWFVYPTIWFSPDVNEGVINRVGKEWKRSESFDSHSVALIIWICLRLLVLILKRSWALFRLRLRR